MNGALQNEADHDRRRDSQRHGLRPEIHDGCAQKPGKTLLRRLGDVCEETKQQNDEALEAERRGSTSIPCSVYTASNGGRSTSSRRSTGR